MPLPEFVLQHRLRIAGGALATLTVAAVTAATVGTSSSPEPAPARLTSSVTDCHDMVTLSVAGRRDTPDAETTKLLLDANGNELPAALSDDYSSEWVDSVANAPSGAVADGSYASVYIAYPASMDSYEDAVNTGVANTQQVMREISAACPDTRFAVVGYSEGSDVVRRVAQNVGNQEAGDDGTYPTVDPDQVTGVVILADPGRSVGDGTFIGADDPFRNPDNFDEAYQDGSTPVSGKGVSTDTSGGFGALDGKVASFCNEGDLTCAAPENISLLQLAANVGRQLNVDALEAEGLTPATGQDVAVTLGNIGLAALGDIAAQPNWMASDETFLDVLLKVSSPSYAGPEAPAPAEEIADDAATDEAITTEELSPLAYLPQKLFNEITGLIVTNQNTIPVIQSDPYNLTLGPNASGHHFDYWRDAAPEDGKPLTSAEYAAAWLTHLAQQAQAGEPLDTTATPDESDVTVLAAVVEEQTRSPEEKWAADTEANESENSSATSTSATASDSATASEDRTPEATTTGAEATAESSNTESSNTAPEQTTTDTPAPSDETPAPSTETSAPATTAPPADSFELPGEFELPGTESEPTTTSPEAETTTAAPEEPESEGSPTTTTPLPTTTSGVPPAE